MALLPGWIRPGTTRWIRSSWPQGPEWRSTCEVYAELDVIRKAAQEYQAEHHTWPGDRNRGQVPVGLEAYLPAGFDFEKEPYVLDYDNWTPTSGAPFQVGLTVICNDEALGRAVLEVLGSNA